MADNFFRLKNNLNELEGVGDLNDLEEDEYDLFNDETFGSDAVVADADWENMHTLLAAEEESTRVRDLKDLPLPPMPPKPINIHQSTLDVERSLHQLLLTDDKPVQPSQAKELTWPTMAPTPQALNFFSGSTPVPKGSSKMPWIPTVEELERQLLAGRNQSPVHSANTVSRPVTSTPHQNSNHVRHPPGFMGPPPGLPSPQPIRPVGVPHFLPFGSGGKPPGFTGPVSRLIGRPLIHHPPHMPPMPVKPIFPHRMPQELLMRAQGALMMPLIGGRAPPPLMANMGMYPRMIPPNHQMRGDFLYGLHENARGFRPPPHPILYPHLTQQHRQQAHIPPQQHSHHQQTPQHQLNWQQKQLMNQTSDSDETDEYANLMTTRQRIWLLNVQIMQLTSDHPFNDYYYTMWKKNHAIASMPKLNGFRKDKDSYFANNRPNEHQRERRDSERVYVPLQFENSLGKIQPKTAIAPRQVFDLNVVMDQQGPQPPTAHKDHRKTKKILLELERLYIIQMKVEEVEDQKESWEENVMKADLINKVLTGFLNEERFLSFLCIRKGKMLLIRCLSNVKNWSCLILTDMWARMLRCFPTILRRDKDDALLPKFYPFLKLWSCQARWEDILSVAKSLLGNSRDGRTSAVSIMRASPCPSKPVLSYILSNQFGISAVSCLLVQGEDLSSALGEQETTQWRQFVEELVKAIASLDILDNAVKPIEPIPRRALADILARQCSRLAAPLHTTAIKVLSS